MMLLRIMIPHYPMRRPAPRVPERYVPALDRDALNDPIMGNIIERTRSRYGKFKSRLTAGHMCANLGYYSFCLFGAAVRPGPAGREAGAD